MAETAETPRSGAGGSWNQAWWTRVWWDFWGGFDRCLKDGKSLLVLLFGLAVGWWVYVPLHELLHALACVVFGGTVERLEIAVLYGGHVYAQLFPFVVAGGDYAGRLAGFDTGGSDWVYLATDLGPYVLTLFPGVWAWRRAGGRGQAWAFGFWLSFALAPFISLTGDAYEIGSLGVTNMGLWSAHPELLGDDLFLVAERVGQQAQPAWGGFALAVLLGVLWSLSTYGLGAWIAGRLGEPTPTPMHRRDAAPSSATDDAAVEVADEP